MGRGVSGKGSPPSRLPGTLEMLRRLANLRYTDEQVRGEGQYITKELQEAVTLEAQKATKRFWPELWEGEDESSGLERLWNVRDLLRAFWNATTDDDRDWYINQMRTYYVRFAIQHENRDRLDDIQKKIIKSQWDKLSEAVLSEMEAEYSRKENGKVWTSAERNAAKEQVQKQNREMAFATLLRMYSNMDKAIWYYKPPENLFWKALSQLRERARWPSRAPRCCARKDKGCPHPYFFASKESRKFCSRKCAELNAQESDRASWHRHKAEWRR
jgi:hypothetical protein